MRRHVLLGVGILGLGLAMALPPAAGAATQIVQVSNFAFTPADITVAPGDTVRWVWVSGIHTTTSGDNCTANGLWSAPLDAAHPVFERVFDGPSGTNSYFCTPHCMFGMVGSVTVGGGLAVPEESAEGSARPALRLAAAPNPLTDDTRIVLRLPLAGHARLDIVDALGRQVATLVDRHMEAGTHAFNWHADVAGSGSAASAAGVYFARITDPSGSSALRLLLVRR